MDKFACDFVLTKCEGEFERDFTNISSTIYDLDSFIDFSADILWHLKDSENIKKLPDGDYHIYISGTAEFESDVDWESGIEEGHFVFDWADKDVCVRKL